MLVKQTSRYNPNKIRRAVRRDKSQPAGMVAFTTKSFTRNDGTEHHAHIDLQTGECTCTCEDFKYRRAPMVKKLDDVDFVSIKTPLLHCKHIARAVNNCVRSGELIQNADKSYSLNHSQAAPVEAVKVPAHIDPETGELKAGYLPNGQVDYNALFED